MMSKALSDELSCTSLLIWSHSEELEEQTLFRGAMSPNGSKQEVTYVVSFCEMARKHNSVHIHLKMQKKKKTKKNITVKILNIGTCMSEQTV